MRAKVRVLPPHEGYDLAAADYDKKENYLNSFEQGRLLPFFDDIAGRNILDVGAGTGRLAVELARRGAIVTALDISGEMLKVLARKSKYVRLAVGEAEDLSFPAGAFDWVLAVFLITHLKNPARFFDEAYRALKDGGRLLVTNINQKEPPEIKTKDGIIKIESYYHRPEALRQQLEELAFQVEEEIFVREGENWVSQIVVARK